MALFKNTYRTGSTRLKGFDYGSEAIYFITICTKNMRHCFGTILDGKMLLSKAGKIVAREWLKTGEMREDRLTLGEWVVMPNHFHGLIYLKPKKEARTDASHASPTQGSHASPIQGSHASQISQPSHSSPASHAPQHLHSPLQADSALGGGCNPPIQKLGKEEEKPGKYQNTFGPQRDNIPSIIRGFKGACTRRIRSEADPGFGWLRGYYDHIVRDQKELLRIEEYIRENPLKWQHDKFKSQLTTDV